MWKTIREFEMKGRLTLLYVDVNKRKAECVKDR